MSKIKEGTQVKLGAIFSYFLIIANTLYTLFITPMILDVIGSSDYGVYKTVASLSSSLMVLDLGLGSTLMRYIAKFKADKEEEKIEPFISMALFEATILALVAGGVSSLFYFSIGGIYSQSFTAAEINLAKKLFAVLAINVVFHIFENVFNGIITGHNNFIFGNGIKVARILLRVALMFVVFFSSGDAVTLVVIDLILTVFLTIAEIICVVGFYKLKIRISFKRWDKGIFKESFVYTGLIFLTSIVSQVQSNFANVVIGAFRGPDLVTIYSFGLTIFQMFMQLSSSISEVMLPTVTNTLRLDDGINKAYGLAIKIGRIQFALLGAAVAGFTVLGKNFIYLWLGDGFEDVYIIVLIMMIPSLFELCINTCLAILRAKNMLGFRTIVICASAALNLLITVIGVKLWSYISAAVGTAASFAFGSVLVMCIYYYKKFGFKMINMYVNIFKRIWLCVIISGIVTAISNHYITGGWISFFANVIVFCAVYGISLLLFGFTKEEKKEIPVINKFFV